MRVVRPLFCFFAHNPVLLCGKFGKVLRNNAGILLHSFCGMSDEGGIYR